MKNPTKNNCAISPKASWFGHFTPSETLIYWITAINKVILYKSFHFFTPSLRTDWLYGPLRMAEFERIEKVSHLRIATQNIKIRKFMIWCCDRKHMSLPKGSTLRLFAIDCDLRSFPIIWKQGFAGLLAAFQDFNDINRGFVHLKREHNYYGCWTFPILLLSFWNPRSFDLEPSC